LIHACVDTKGGLRIVAPTTNCTSRETRLTWPAEPEDPPAPVTFYQRVSPTQPVAQGFATVIALCDAPEDVATGGGFRFDGVSISDSATAVVTSASCAASGLCASAPGLDGWVVVAKSTNVAAEGTRVTAYVVCAQS
jgi:hypothetical protein